MAVGFCRLLLISLKKFVIVAGLLSFYHNGYKSFLSIKLIVFIFTINMVNCIVFKNIVITEECTQHKISYFPQFLNVYSSVALSTCTLLCKPTLSISRNFSSSQSETLSPLNTHTLFSHPSSIWQTLFYFLSLWICLI